MTAAELIQSLPQRYKSGSGTTVPITFHFKIDGEHGGRFTVIVNNDACTVIPGLTGEPKCIVEAKDNDYEDVEYGRTNAQMAVLFGKIKISNIPSMLKFVDMFERVA